LRKGTEAIVYLPKCRVLSTMPSVPPLGQERDRPRRPAAVDFLWPRTGTGTAGEGARSGGESTVAR
jgi:hypothetical protein